MWTSFEKVLVAFNRWILIVLMLIMACIVFANVVLRYTTGDSIVWAEEVARHLMIWGTFLGAGLVLRFGGHVAIDNLHQQFSEPVARMLRAIVLSGLAIFFVAMIYYSSLYVWAMRFQTTAATDIPIAWIYLAMPVGFALMLAHLLFVARTYYLQGRYIDSPEIDAEAAASL